MRIGIAFRRFHVRSGLPHYCVELARHLARTDEVFLFARVVEAETGARRIVRFPWLFHSMRLEHGPNSLVNSALVGVAKRVLGLDVVNTQGADLLGFDVITAHGTWWGHFRSHASLNPAVSTELGKSMMPIVERANYRGGRYKRIIAVSDLTRGELRKAYDVAADDIAVIPEGVDLDRFRSDAARRSAWRRTMGFDGESVLLHVSTDFVRKGLMTIVRAMHHIEGRPHLVVVGPEDPGPYRAEGHRLGVRSMTFLRSADAIEDCYAGADAFVFPSHYEAFGLSLMEAMASGLPVVCTRGLGAAELMTDGKDALLLDRWDNPRELAEMVNVALSEEGKVLGRSARRTAEQYPWERTASRSREVYESCLRR